MDKIHTKGRLIYIDPNDLASFAGFTDTENRKDNVYWNPEELNTTVDLQVIVPNRRDAGSINYNGEEFTVSLTNVSGESTVWSSFFEGENLTGKEKDGKYLTDSYTDMSYTEIKNGTGGNKECLGIESVDIDFNPSFYPEVTIKFTDIHGYSLMNPTEETESEGGKKRGYRSFFNALFHFPYPRFMLSVKGPFGTRVTFMLAVNEFSSAFNSETGNFDVTVTFIGYMYGLYTDIPFNFLIMAPYIDNQGNSVISTNADGENKRGAGQYWSDKCNAGIFKTKEDDAILPTFIDFLNKYNEIKIQLADKQRDLLANGRAYATIQENIEKIASAKSMKNNFTTILEKIKDNGYAENENTGSRINDFESFRGKIKFWSKEEKHPCTWSDNFDECIKAEENLDGTISIPEKDILKGDITFIQDTNKSGETKYYFIINISDFYSKVNSIIGKLTSENDSLDTKSIEEEKEVIKQLLGFYPNIENIYRIIFAHIDTFFHHFYTRVIDIIKNKARKISDFINLNRSETDVKSGDFLPPFPAVYKGTQRREIIYPGEYGNGNVFTSENMEELKFVEEILQASIQLHNETDIPLETASTESLGSPSLKFAPTCATDVYFYLNGITPYDNIVLSKSYNHNIEVLAYILYRGYLINAFKNGTATNYYVAEASNYRYISGGIEKSVANFLKIQMMGDKLDDTLNKIKELLKSSNIIYKDKMIFDGDNMYINDESIQGEDSYPIIDFFKDLKEPKELNTERYFIHNTEPEGCTDKNKEGTLKIWDEYRTSAKYDYEAIKTLSSNLDEILETENDEGEKYFEEINGDSVSESIKSMFNSDIFSISDKYGSPKYSRLYKRCPDDGYDCEGNEVDYDTFMTRAVSGLISDYTFRFLKVNFNNEIKPAFQLLKIDKDNLWKETFSKDNDGEYYGRLLLFLTACMESGSLYTKSNDYKRTLFSILEESKLVSLPIFYLIYLGGLIHAMRWSKEKGDGKYYLYPLFRFKEGETIEYNKIYDIKNGYELPVINLSRNGNNIGEVKYEINNKTKQDVLEDLFLDYVNIFQRKVEGLKYLDNKEKANTVLYSNGEIIENTSLDTFLVSIYTKNAYFLTVNRFGNGLNGEDVWKTKFGPYPKLNYREYIKNFLDKLTNEDYLIDNTTDEVENRITDSSHCSKEQKLAAYQSLKALYDKWLSGYKKEQFELPSPQERLIRVQNKLNGIENSGIRCEFDNFIFADSFYNDISSDFFINVESFYKQIIGHINSESNQGTYEFMAELAQNNKMLFLALPIYTNFTKAEDLTNMFSPHTLYNRYDNVAESIGNTYLLLYPHESSHHIDETDDSEYGDDGFDLIGSEPINVFDEPTPEETKKLTIYVPSFAVSFGKQNQQYFKNISVNMDNPRMTDNSIANMFDLANVSREGDTYEPSTIGQDLFSIYSNRSYECTVTMMGCANIMPMMYFQLNNIPMFKGAYMIYSVKHHIVAGDMTTEFTGMRMSRNLIPFNNHIFNFKQFGSEAKATIANNYSYNTNSDTDINEAAITPVTNKNIEDSDEYKVSKALEYLKNNKVCTTKKCTPKPPYNCTNKGTGICTAAAWRAVEAAGIKNMRSGNPRAFTDNLQKHNFKVFKDFNNTNINEIEEWLKVYAKPGDVITYTRGLTPYGDSDGSYGHSSIYFGPLEDGKDFISDFRHGFYVYKSLGNTVYNYRIHRHSSLMGDYGPKAGSIIYSGYAKSDITASLIKSHEGGWSNHPSDKGGCTMSGITISTYRAHYGSAKTCDDLKKLTETQWNEIFNNDYWKPWKADTINCQSIVNLIVDWGFIGGVQKSIKNVGSALGVSGIDAIIEKINSSTDKQDIFNKIWIKRKETIDSSKQTVFKQGWMNRLNSYTYQG